MESAVLKIIAFQPEHQPWFEKFNRDWIEKFFWMEPIDMQVLQHPQEHIIDPGGAIWMALWNNELAGTVAMKKVNEGCYEMTKMAVDEKFRGNNIGKALVSTAVEFAKKAGAEDVILYSSTRLTTAISLYRNLGFLETPLDGPYKRSDIKMRLELKNLVAR